MGRDGHKTHLPGGDEDSGLVSRGTEEQQRRARATERDARASHLLLPSLAKLEHEALEGDRAAKKGLLHVGRLELRQPRSERVLPTTLGL